MLASRAGGTARPRDEPDRRALLVAGCRHGVVLAELSSTDAGSPTAQAPTVQKQRQPERGKAHPCSYFSSYSVNSLPIQELLTFLLDLSLFPIGLTESWCFMRDLEFRSPELRSAPPF